ncbi:MAG: Dabb family protein [bacterium]|nr:Dabb family protein [bacterium]
MTCCSLAPRYLMLLLGVLLAGGVILAINQPTSVAHEQGEKVLRHVVMFQFKESSSEADIQGVVDAFRGLPAKISEISDFEYGVNNSPEGLNDGLTHCFLVSFRSEEDRAKYLPHPAHKAFVEVLKPHLEKVTVIDYWAAE